MSDKEFYKNVDLMFKSKLERHKIRIHDIKNDKIMSESDMNYLKVFFDSNLNIYKLVEGIPVPVDDNNYKAVII